MALLLSSNNNSSSSSTISSKLLTAYFVFGAIGPLPSIVLYTFFPSGTVEFFHGTPSSTAAFWCSTNGSADATISFLCWSALLTKQAEIKVLVLQAFVIYAVFHWGAFWYWSNHSNAHPIFLQSAYPVSICISLVAAVWWGYLHPPKSTAETTPQFYETLPEAITTHNITTRDIK